MDKQSFKEFIGKLKEANDKLERLELLADLVDDYNNIMNENEINKNKLAEVTDERDRYARLNNKYFLQLQSQDKHVLEDVENDDGENNANKNKDDGENNANKNKDDGEETLELDFLGGDK